MSEWGLPWREDASNQNQRFARNRLRLTTLPALARDYNPQVEEALAGIAELSRAEEEYWAVKVRRLYRRIATSTPRGPVLNVKPLADFHLAVKRRIIRHAILQAKGSLRSIDRRHVEGLLGIVESEHGHDRLNIPGIDAVRSFDYLLLAAPEVLKQGRDYLVRLQLGIPFHLPFGIGTLSLTIQENESSFLCYRRRWPPLRE